MQPITNLNLSRSRMNFMLPKPNQLQKSSSAPQRKRKYITSLVTFLDYNSLIGKEKRA